MIEFVAVIILIVWFFINASYTDKALRELTRIKCSLEAIEIQNSASTVNKKEGAKT